MNETKKEFPVINRMIGLTYRGRKIEQCFHMANHAAYVVILEGCPDAAYIINYTDAMELFNEHT